MDDAGLGRMVVATEKVLLRAHAHVGGGHGDVGVEGEVVGRVVNRCFAASGRRDELGRSLAGGHAGFGAVAVIDTVVVALAERILAHRAAGVVGHVGDVGREKALVGLMHAGGDVGPPEKCLHERGAVVGADF